MTEYRPHYKWRLTWPGERDDDFAGYDGEQYIGRIYRTDWEPIRGRWKWNGNYPPAFRGVVPSPNSGFVRSAREASQRVEEYWDKLKA